MSAKRLLAGLAVILLACAWALAWWASRERGTAAAEPVVHAVTAPREIPTALAAPAALGSTAERRLAEAVPKEQAEARAGITSLPRAYAAPVGYVLVLDASNRLPIPGVAVRLTDSPHVLKGATAESITDAHGLARFFLPPARVLHGSTRAERHGPVHFAIGPGHETQATALVVLLPPGGTLRGRVVDGLGAPIPAALVRVTGSAAELGARTLSWRLSAADESWECRSGDGGEFEIPGLAPDAHLAVEVRAAGMAVPQEDLRLRPGEVREVTYGIHPGTLLQGVLLDADGRPCPNAELWLLAGDHPRMLHANEDHHDATRTKEDGSFLFEHVPPGSWLVGPASSSELTPWAAHVDIPSSAPVVELLLRLPDELFVSGRTVGPEGEPVAGVALVAFGNTVVADGESQADGSFRLGPLVEGDVRVWAMSAPDGLTGEGMATAIAGTEGIVIRLSRGGSVVVRVRGEPGEVLQGEVALSSIEDLPRDSMMQITSIGAGRTCTFDGLQPGLYAVLARTETGRVGTAGPIRIGAGEEAEAEILVGPSGRLRIHGPVCTGQVDYYVVHQGAVVDFGSISNAEGAVSSPLPMSTVTVELSPEEGVAASKTVTVLAGETMDVSFE